MGSDDMAGNGGRQKASGSGNQPSELAPRTLRVVLNGEWEFRHDTEQDWRPVTVPHTWQVDPGLENHRGVADYRRQFDVPREWLGQAVDVEFEAVFHTAEIMLNGRAVGRHDGKGYTAFSIDLTSHLKYGSANEIVVRVDNAFNDLILPRGRSSDWAHDGGIYRPVSLLIRPTTFIERVAIEAVHVDARATIGATVVVQNRDRAWLVGTLRGRVIDEETGTSVLVLPESEARVEGAGVAEIQIPAETLAAPKLWHFDRPHLYRLEVTLVEDGVPRHTVEETFGIRSFDIRDGGFWLNGERIWPMGVERMAGSHPDYGMAEPEEWIAHDLADMQNLNCVFTRAHLPQDRRVLDYCDRHGIMIQLEVPAWGFLTFREKGDEPLPAIMDNGLEQLSAMIERDRNHPSVVAWGLCNEVDGQNPAAYAFARRMYDEAKRLDPGRPCTYASNSLFKSPGKDVASIMDFVSFNEYYGTWQAGTVSDLRKNLEEIVHVFPDKPVVISEFGYLAGTSGRPEGDEERIRILREHQAVFREFPQIAGIIFFCYNDYRTQIGETGSGALQQRVHGVVDIYGRRKPSYEVLREESSPVESLTVYYKDGGVRVSLTTRRTQPAYTLRGYLLECVIYGKSQVAVERQRLPLDDLAPGTTVSHEFMVGVRTPQEVAVEVRRPCGASARSVALRL
jgi:beta-glucuronidase